VPGGALVDMRASITLTPVTTLVVTNTSSDTINETFTYSATLSISVGNQDLAPLQASSVSTFTLDAGASANASPPSPATGTLEITDPATLAGLCSTYHGYDAPISVWSDLTPSPSATVSGQPVSQVTFAITYDYLPGPACFVAGALIATEEGEIAVERLRVGDRVTTATGKSRPVVWIGRRRVDLARHPKPQEVWPVRVQAHAFADGSPRRDLWLSPGHNIAFDGALMPISALVNGVSVARVKRPSVDYWHVELDAHDILLAEGLPAESYLDCGNRAAFENGGACVEAHPDFMARHQAKTCLPLVKNGPLVVAARRRLQQRLFAEGYSLDGESDAHIVADGRRFEPVRLSERRLVFILPEGCARIELRSQVFVPAGASPDSDDVRELGLCAARLEIDGDAAPIERHGFFDAGWREAEWADGRFQHRWTAGAARIPSGSRLIMIDLAGDGAYWREPAAFVLLLKAARG
jgi:hypothetical protein